MDRVESIGVAKTLETLSGANLALVVIDGAADLDDNDRVVLEKAAALPHIIVINKSDLHIVIPPETFADRLSVQVSARTGAGFSELTASIKQFIGSTESALSDDSVLLNNRQNDAILRTITALATAMTALEHRIPHEMVLLDLYESLSALGELTGEVVSDDILGRIFSTFCIGK
jgi:tRNA modification GTPase